MQVITIYAEKGGVGKTTIAGIIGAGLAQRGQRVLWIDADGQADLTRNFRQARQPAFFIFVKWIDPAGPYYVETRRLIVPVRPNCYLVPGNNDTWGIPGSTNLEDIVRGISSRLHDLRGLFDVVLIDTQPSATTLHDAIGLVTDYFICPTDPEPLSAYGGLRSTIEHIQFIRERSLSHGRNKARLMGIIPNKYRMTTGLHRHVYDTLVQGIRDDEGKFALDEKGNVKFEGYGEMVWEPLPLRTTIPEMQLYQETLVDMPEMWAIVDRVQAVLGAVESVGQHE